MKRILTLFLLVVMCLGVCSLAGCQLTPGTGTTSTTTEPTTPPVDVMAQAKVLVRELYKDSAVAPKKDYTLVSQIVVAGETYPVTWSVDTDLVTISEEPVDGFYVVDLPASNDTEVAYVLTATITVGEVEGTVTFERTLPLINYTAVTELEENVAYKLFFDSATLNQMLYAKASTVSGNKYIDTTNDPKAAPDYFAEKVDGGYKFYTTDANGNKLYVNPNLQAASDGHWSKYLGLAESTEAVFTYNADKAAWVVTLEGTEYYMGTYNTYNTFSISESSHLPSDTSFPGGFLTKADAEALAPDAPPAVEIPTLEGAVKPEVGQKYLAGMAKGDKAYYLTGSMQATYYFGTATNSTLGINCYVEAADNGYYLYAIIQGAKKYINVTVSGSHVNCNYQDTAATVWTWNDTLKTLETSVDGTAYIMGTQAIGTYTTVGMVKAADENNYVQFVPSTNPDQEAPSDQPITIPEALALEDGAAVVVKGTVGEITEAWSSYNNMSFYIEDEAGNKLLVFRCKTQVNTGDVVTVTGVMGSYNGAKQVASGSTAKIETAPSVITTIPEALTAEDGAALVLKGKVVEIKEAWSSYNNMSYYIEDEDGNRFYVFRSVTQINLGDVVTVTGTLGSYQGSKQVAQGATAVVNEAAPVDPNPTVITTIADALTADVGAQVKLVGTVLAIDTPWSEQHGNISVILTDGTNNILLYRMKTNVNVGDKIEVTGTVGTYNSTNQIAAGATATILEKAPVEMTIPEAVAAADGTAVIVKGTVKEINTAWSEQHGNITVTIEDADGNTLYVYRLATNVAVGDDVVITGKMGTYNDARQIAAGATATIVPKPSAGATTYSYTFVKGVYTANNSTANLGGINWAFAGTAKATEYFGYDTNNTPSKGFQFGSGNNPWTALTLTSDSLNDVTKIVINTSGASSIVGTLTVSVGGTEVKTITLTKTATVYTIELTEALDGEVVLSYSQTSSKAIYISSIEITYTPAN